MCKVCTEAVHCVALGTFFFLSPFPKIRQPFHVFVSERGFYVNYVAPKTLQTKKRPIADVEDAPEPSPVEKSPKKASQKQ